MKLVRLLLLSLPSILSAGLLTGCGEGYEVVKVRGQVPYTEERTAGPGVAYVRAHLMPAKTVILPPAIIAPDATAESLFHSGGLKK